MPHLNILNDHQRWLLETLVLPEDGRFYLAGGTALALQIGHRTSVDFDFYAKDSFDSLDLLAALRSQIPELRVQTQQEKTLRVLSGDTEISFFAYPYELIRLTIPLDRFELASIEDIAAMKLIAIVQRGTQRDFVDIYFLLQRFSLKELIGFVKEKFSGYQETLLLRALVYFDDAENAAARKGVRILTDDYSWQKAKDYIVSEVKKYQLGRLNPTL